MQLGPGAREQAPLPGAERAIAPLAGGTELIAYGTGKGLETAASAWATGPVKAGAKASGDLAVASRLQVRREPGRGRAHEQLPLPGPRLVGLHLHR